MSTVKLPVFITKVIAFVKRAPEYAKALVAALGGILSISAALSDSLGIHIIPAGWAPVISVIFVVLTGIATYRTPNATPTDPSVA